MSRKVYARLTGRPGIYRTPPPRCPVHGGYMPFLYARDVFACRRDHEGRWYYVTAAAWRHHQAAGDPGLCGWFAEPLPHPNSPRTRRPARA